jgi:hypothetical protein
MEELEEYHAMSPEENHKKDLLHMASMINPHDNWWREKLAWRLVDFAGKVFSRCPLGTCGVDEPTGMGFQILIPEERRKPE